MGRPLTASERRGSSLDVLNDFYLKAKARISTLPISHTSYSLDRGREATFSKTWTRNPYRGTSLIRKRPPPRTHHMDLCILLLWGPGIGLFLMSEVPL